MKFILAHFPVQTEAEEPTAYLSGITFDYEGLDYDQILDPDHLQKPKDFVMEPFKDMARKFDSEVPEDCQLAINVLIACDQNWDIPGFDVVVLGDRGPRFHS